IPGLSGIELELYDKLVPSPDGKWVWMAIRIYHDPGCPGADYCPKIVELQRDPATGELTNARVEIQNGKPIPVIPGQNGQVRDTQIPFEQNTRLWVRAMVGGVWTILEFTHNPATGELSDARAMMTGGDPIPGLRDMKWDVGKIPGPSADGRK